MANPRNFLTPCGVCVDIPVMEWIFEVIKSEFLWGTVLGVLLSIVSAVVGLKLQGAHTRKSTLLFCEDIAFNIIELVQQLEDLRGRDTVIHKDFLDLIEVEVGIYGRNREHMVAIKDGPLRREIRDFFTRVIMYTTRVKLNLDVFSRHLVPDGAEVDSALSNQSNAVADAALLRARQQCDLLRDLAATKGEALIQRLKDGNA